MTITNWPKEERPREKLLKYGERYLSDAELLAIFLNTGTRGKTALDLARELLTNFGGLKKLFSMPSQALYQKSGIGPAKYVAIRAAIELGQRYLQTPLQIGEILNSSIAAKQLLASRLRDYQHEVFACLFLTTQHRILCFEELFHGTIHETNVYPREVIKRGLLHNAAKVILAHNHPSGDPKPSQADQDMTQLLKEALSFVDINVIDHIVIGHHEHFSLAEAGLL